MLGNGRLEAFCFDGKVRLCHMCVASVRGGAAGGEAECQLPLRLPSLQPWQDAQEGVGRRRRHHHGLAARLPGACGPVSLRVARLCFTWMGGLQDDKGDVILKYTADEARQLKSSGQLPENGAAGGACPRSPGRAPSFPPPPPSSLRSCYQRGRGRRGGRRGRRLRFRRRRRLRRRRRHRRHLTWLTQIGRRRNVSILIPVPFIQNA